MGSVFLRFPEGKKKALTLSYDDGVEQDIRLMKIMDQHGIKGTFNLNSGLFAPEGHVYPPGQLHRRMTEKQAKALYTDSGHEVAVHGVTHPFLEQLPLPAAVHEVLADRIQLECLFGTVIRGMAYPFGTYSDELIAGLHAAGITYARTVKYTEGFDIPTDWLRLKATCHHDNPNLMKLSERFVNETPTRAPWLFYLWGHSYEFEGNHNWQVIENFCEKVGNKADIWYATNIQIYDYIEAYHRLQFSADCSIVYNPNAVSVWFEKDGKLFAVKSGETLNLE